MNEHYQGKARDWVALIRILRDRDTFVFSTHLEPDADGLGAELGLARFLRQLGKQVTILNPSEIRTNLTFMPGTDEVQVFSEVLHSDFIREAQVFIAFDIGHYNRLSSLCPVLETSGIQKICIDHHPGDKSHFDLVFDDAQASSTGIMIYDLIHAMDPSALNRNEIAHPLYAAMMSDTGNFRFNNTDPETLHAAANLVAAGVKPYELYVQLYENLNTRSRLYVMRELLDKVQFACEGRLAWSALDFADLAAHGVQSDDLHSLSDFLRSIYGVEIGVSITKVPGQPTDVSMRSKGHIPVNTVAQSFDGGGHAFAAGCRLNGSLEQDTQLLIDRCQRAIREWDKDHGSA